MPIACLWLEKIPTGDIAQGTPAVAGIRALTKVCLAYHPETELHQGRHLSLAAQLQLAHLQRETVLDQVTERPEELHLCLPGKVLGSLLALFGATACMRESGRSDFPAHERSLEPMLLLRTVLYAFYMYNNIHLVRN